MIFPAPSENAKSGSGQNITAQNDIAAAAKAAHTQSTVRLIVANLNPFSCHEMDVGFVRLNARLQPTRPAIGGTSALSGNTLLASTLSSTRK